MSPERREAIKLVSIALNILEAERTEEEYYDSALWRLVDAAGIVSTNITSRGTSVIGMRGQPTGRGYFVGEGRSL